MGAGRAAMGAFRRADCFRLVCASGYAQAEVSGYAVSILWSDSWSGQMRKLRLMRTLGGFSQIG